MVLPIGWTVFLYSGVVALAVLGYKKLSLAHAQTVRFVSTFAAAFTALLSGLYWIDSALLGNATNSCSGHLYQESSKSNLWAANLAFITAALLLIPVIIDGLRNGPATAKTSN